MRKREDNAEELEEIQKEDAENAYSEEEKIESNNAESETDENRSTETEDDLIRDKRDNQFNASKNSANMQIFLQNANFNGGTGFKQILDLLGTGSSKKYNLEKEEDCAEFFRTCKNREYLTLAIIISVFEIVAVGDLANLKETLMLSLPPIFQLDNEGKEIHSLQNDPYLSLNTALSVIGGKMFITDEGQQCVGYKKGSKKVLSNIWIQFPDLRKAIVTWLLKVNNTFECQTAFEAYQITTAFVRIISEDFLYAQKQVFVRLYSRPDNLGLLARIAIELMKKEETKNNTLHMVMRWAESDSGWLWKSAFLVYLYTGEKYFDARFEDTLTKTIRNKFYKLENADLKFIAILACYFKEARRIVSAVFKYLYKLNHGGADKQLAYIYLRLIRYGYYEINDKLTELPFVVCDSKEQMKRLVPILKYSMTQYNLRCRLYLILRVYIEEIANYDTLPSTVRRITAYFYCLAENDGDYQRDILFFLRECNGNVAENVYHMLAEIYKRGETRR